MKRIFSLLIIGSVACAGTAFAQETPQKQREKLMKMNGDSLKLVSDMLKGEKPYDAKAAGDSLKTIAPTLDEFVTLFPEGSIEGSYAKPEIMANKAEFDSLAVEAKEASIKAAAAAAGGPEALAPAVGALGKACQACHEKYRKED
jgi:cytochrome c556